MPKYVQNKELCVGGYSRMYHTDILSWQYFHYIEYFMNSNFIASLA